MQRRSFLRAALASVPALRLDAGPGKGVVRRKLANAREVHSEIAHLPGAETVAGEYFPTFHEYQETVLYHPAFGYYSSGRVSFTADYQTFPNTLAPYFGQMIAEQIFHMWESQRSERFTILEYGAGNGALAESILDYLDRPPSATAHPRWAEFAAQTTYICCDRAPAMRDQQRRRNARFGNRFEARTGDATDPIATLAPGSLTGVVLSNELVDNFGVHKVLLSPQGSVEAAYVVPSLPRSGWEKIRKTLPGSIGERIVRDDQAIRARVLGGEAGSALYLSRGTLIGLLESIRPPDLSSIQFQETYVPARMIPELAEHFRRYAGPYAHELAKRDLGLAAYVSPGLDKFVQGAARVLKTGYVITVDYGANWSGALNPGPRPHLRTYGQGSRQLNPSRQPVSNDLALDSSLGHMEGSSAGSSGGITTGGDSSPVDAAQSDPYRGPTLNDITVDVNFGLMDAAGQMTGLRSVYFGPQRALQSGTPVSLSAPPADVPLNDPRRKEFDSWVKEFLTNATFKVLVQQKEGAGASYSYQDRHPELLGFKENDLKPAQRARLAGIEQRLRGEVAHV